MCSMLNSTDMFYRKSAGTIAPIVIGFFLLIATGIYEVKIDQTFPLFPPSVFGNVRGFTLVCGSIFLYGMLYYSIGVLWPQQIQYLYTTDRYKIGWYAGAAGFSGWISAPLAGILFRWIGHARWQLVFYVIMLTAGTAACAVVSK